MATFHERVERLKSVISKAEMFVNTGGDPKGTEAGRVRAELVKAWGEFAEEFAEETPESEQSRSRDRGRDRVTG